MQYALLLHDIKTLKKNSMSPIRFDPHCVQTDPAKNVWTRAYLIPERNRTVRRQEFCYLFVFCMNLGEINALLTISCCQMKHFGYDIVYKLRNKR